MASPPTERGTGSASTVGPAPVGGRGHRLRRGHRMPVAGVVGAGAAYGLPRLLRQTSGAVSIARIEAVATGRDAPGHPGASAASAGHHGHGGPQPRADPTATEQLGRAAAGRVAPPRRPAAVAESVAIRVPTVRLLAPARVHLPGQRWVTCSRHWPNRPARRCRCACASRPAVRRCGAGSHRGRLLRGVRAGLAVLARSYLARSAAPRVSRPPRGSGLYAADSPDGHDGPTPAPVRLLATRWCSDDGRRGVAPASDWASRCVSDRRPRLSLDASDVWNVPSFPVATGSGSAGRAVGSTAVALVLRSRWSVTGCWGR